MKKNKGISVFQPQSADNKTHQARWLKLFGSSRALALLGLAKQHGGPFLVIMPDARAVQLLEQELAFFTAKDNALPIHSFPDWECLPYDSFSPHQDIVSQRLLTLSRLSQLRTGIVLTTVSTIMHRLTPVDYVSSHSFQLTVGSRLDPVEFRDRLSHASYRPVSQVMEPGEYAVRGGLIDVFPMGSPKPYRIDLFDDEIDSLRSFDPQTQRSIGTLDNIELLPAREFPLTEEGVRRFRQAFRAQFEGDPTQTGIYHDISNGIVPAGAEYYLPLFFEQTATIFDYLPKTTTLVVDTGIEAAAGQFQAEITERFLERRHDRQRPILKPEQLFLEPDWTIAQLKSYPIIEFGGGDPAFLSQAPAINYNSSLPLPLPVDHRHASPYHLLFEYLKNSSHRCLFVAETAGRKETLRELLHANDISPAPINSWSDFISSDMIIRTLILYSFYVSFNRILKLAIIF